MSETLSVIDEAVMHDEIEKRAYEVFVSRGRTDGRHLEDWFAAEEQLKREHAHDWQPRHLATEDSDATAPFRSSTSFSPDLSRSTQRRSA